MVTEL